MTFSVQLASFWNETLHTFPAVHGSIMYWLCTDWGARTEPSHVTKVAFNLSTVLQQYHEDGARIEAAFRRYIHRADPKQKEDSYEIIVCHANVIRYFVCRFVSPAGSVLTAQPRPSCFADHRVFNYAANAFHKIFFLIEHVLHLCHCALKGILNRKFLFNVNTLAATYSLGGSSSCASD